MAAPQRKKDPRVDELADEAKSLEKGFERVEDAIFQALTNMGIHERAERIRLLGQIKAELWRRGAPERERERQERRELEEHRRADMLRDAWAHERRQPPDTYTPSDPPRRAKR